MVGFLDIVVILPHLINDLGNLLGLTHGHFSDKEIQSFLFKKYLIDAGKYFLTRKNKTLDTDDEVLNFALEEMKIRNFNLKKRIIEA